MCAIHGDGMHYEVDKEYSMNERDINLCFKGYHFCSNIEDTALWYYGFSNNLLFEIDTLDGKIIKANRKNVTNKIKLIREIPLEEIKEYFKIHSKRLVYDNDYRVRRELAKFGYQLDILYQDTDPVVVYHVEESMRKKAYLRSLMRSGTINNNANYSIIISDTTQI